MTSGVYKHKPYSDEYKRRMSKILKGRKVWNKGKHHTKEHIDKIRLKHTGKHLSEETRLKISIAHKGKKKKPCSEETRLKLSLMRKGKKLYEITDKIREKLRKANIGKKLSEETKRKIGLASIGNKYRLGQHPSEETREKLRNKRKNRVLPLKDSLIEVKIQNFLKLLGIEFYSHFWMNIEHGYQSDIFIPSSKTIIECDGDYWHGNLDFLIKRNKDINIHQIKQKLKDDLRTKELREKGYKVIRLWESEIKPMSLDKFKEIINDRS